MLRSFYSGISGLRNFQTKLDVVSNNIANVNTVGFKASRVMFQDVMSQTLQGATAPSGTMGGVNPKQVGVGAAISSIDTRFTNGSLQTTNYATDFYIDGDGFFLVTGDGGNVKYLTRAGNFKLDANGDLVDTRGMKVMGVKIDYDANDGFVPTNPLETIPDPNPNATPTNIGENSINLKYVHEDAFMWDDSTQSYIKPSVAANAIEIVDYTISSDGLIEVLGSDGNKYIQPYKIAMVVVQNPEGLLKVGNSLYQFTGNADIGNLEDHITTPNNPETGSGAIYSGFLEMSNVDLSEEFTEMIIAQRGFQANSRIITTSDEVLQELVNLKR